MDEKVCDRVNVLNSLQYNTKRKEKQLKELETQHDKMTGGSTENSAAAESEDGQVGEADDICSYSCFGSCLNLRQFLCTNCK